jgi:serine protease Do
MFGFRFSPVWTASSAAALLTMGLGAAPLGPDPFEPQEANTQVFRVGPLSGSYLGVNLREIDSQRAKELKLREEAGVEITRVEEDSPAARAGLKVGDVVLTYNGQRVEGMEEFSRLVRETPAGREVKLQITRDGNTQTIVAKLGSRKNMAFPGAIAAMPRIEAPVAPVAPVMPDLPRTIMMWRTAALGIEAEALRGQMADFFGVKDGVLVRSVMKDTPAAKAGLKAGDIITKVGDTKVTTPNEVTSAIRAIHDKKSIPLTVIRDHHETTLTATIDDDRSEWGLPARSITAPAFNLHM